VKKVAVYKDRVAIQLSNRVVLYQLEEGAGELDMQYHSAAKINKKLECNLLVVTSQHIVLCQVRSYREACCTVPQRAVGSERLSGAC
jgi:intraflagellar transport protein 122